jgi:hypothetical protein
MRSLGEEGTWPGELEIMGTPTDLYARLQNLHAELGEVRRHRVMLMEQIDTVHREHQSLLAEAMPIMTGGVADRSTFDHARTLLMEARRLVQEERQLLLAWQRLFEVERALWLEHRTLLTRIANPPPHNTDQCG